MDNNKTLFILIAVIFLIAGIGAGMLISSNLNKKGSTIFSSKYNTPDAPNTFEAGWEAAKKKVEETPYIPVAVSQGEIKSIKGRIITVGEQQITIEARLFNPLDDEKLKTRTVGIDESSEIIIREEKDREAIRKEQEEYNKKMEDYKSGKISSMPSIPEISIERVSSIEDLKEGQTVTIESEENIREAVEFTASKVLVR